ncbi:hypothetical protein BGX26_000261 [Mortierella sp. AD094]|nr:hypothetical protein BGX26_000261 [Mortierella sp. AD094]
MSFAANTGFLKADFLMSAILCLLGFIVLGSMANNSYLQLMIAAGGVGLFAMDFVTWKRSDRFKGKRASIAAMFIAPTMSFFAFSTAIVIGVGIKDFCNNFEVNGVPRPDSCHADLKNFSGLQTGVGAATVAGFISAFYGVSEYLQYRRRHINGDKW